VFVTRGIRGLLTNQWLEADVFSEREHLRASREKGNSVLGRHGVPPVPDGRDANSASALFANTNIVIFWSELMLQCDFAVALIPPKPPKLFVSIN
jgi:hypothetical protein